MKILARILASSLLLMLASVGFGASTPSMDVTVSNASGKLVFKGKTNGSGTFATGKLDPGNYVVQFNSKDSAVKSGQFIVVASAGKKKVSADAVPGAKFGAGGVAMKVDVGVGLNITGQVASSALAGANPNVKIIKGKRFVWVKGGETGSNLGGHWVEEGTPEARNTSRLSRDAVNKIQEHADTHQEGFPSGR